MELKCSVCASPFAAAKRNALYCSASCRQNSYRERRRALRPVADADSRERNRLRSAAWRAANPERARELNRRWATKNREKTRENYQRYARNNPELVRGRALRQYGLSLQDYDAMLAVQAGVCAICGEPETHRHHSGTVRRLAVDHDHATGAVRGLLCHRCNLSVGKFSDDPALFEAAAAYLRRSS